MISISSARTTELGASANLPLVAWSIFLTVPTAIISSSRGVLTDGALANAYSGTTFDYWLPNMTGANVSYKVTFAAPVVVSFAAIVGHNLADLGATVLLQRSTDGGATWTGAGAAGITPTTNEPIAFRNIIASSNLAADWRFQFNGVASGASLYIADLFFGTEIVFPVGIYAGVAPPIWPTEVQLQSNVSVGGNYVGSSVITQGSSIAAKLDYLTPSFVRSTLADFVPSFNSGVPFWFAWRPQTFVSDLRFCWRNGGAAIPVNMGLNDLMSLSLSMQAFEG